MIVLVFGNNAGTRRCSTALWKIMILFAPLASLFNMGAPVAKRRARELRFLVVAGDVNIEKKVGRYEITNPL